MGNHGMKTSAQTGHVHPRAVFLLGSSDAPTHARVSVKLQCWIAYGAAKCSLDPSTARSVMSKCAAGISLLLTLQSGTASKAMSLTRACGRVLWA